MNNSLKGNLLVICQFILLGLLILYPSNSINYGPFALTVTIAIAVLLALGLVILGLSFLALGRSLTAHPIPAKNGELVTDGLYRFARHPIYTGLLAIGLAMTLSGGLFPHMLFS